MLTNKAQLEEQVKAVSSEQLAKHLEAACGIRRDMGGEGEEQMVQYILDVLDENGIPYIVHEHDAYLSYPRSSSLTVKTGDQVTMESLTHPFATSAGPGECVAELIHVQDKDYSKAVGKVVLIDGMASPIEALKASNAGVRAVIFANPSDVLHNTIVSTIWGGAPTPSEAHRLPKVPVITISHDDGAELKKRMAQ